MMMIMIVIKKIRIYLFISIKKNTYMYYSSALYFLLRIANMFILCRNKFLGRKQQKIS